MPRWLDERFVLFMEDGEIKQLELTTAEVTTVLATGRTGLGFWSKRKPGAWYIAFAVAPDRQTIYCSRMTAEADIWTVELD